MHPASAHRTHTEGIRCSRHCIPTIASDRPRVRHVGLDAATKSERASTGEGFEGNQWANSANASSLL